MPALPDFVRVARARGVGRTSVHRIPDRGHAGSSRATRIEEGFVRRQALDRPDRSEGRRFQSALDDLLEETAGSWTIRGRGATDVGVLTWSPPDGVDAA